MRIQVGIDPGKRTHQVCFLREGRTEGRPLAIPNDRKGFQELAAILEAYQGQGHLVEAGIEPSGHYWENLGYFLQDQGYLVKLINPFHVSRYKEILDNTPTKTDAKDSKIIATLLHQGRTLSANLPRSPYAELRRLTSLRLDLLQERRRLRCKLHVWVDRFFPEYQTLMSDLAGPTSLGILKKYGSPDKIARTSEEELAGELRRLSRGRLGWSRARELKEQAAHSVGQTVSPQAAALALELLTGKLWRIRQEVNRVERAIRKLLPQLPEAVDLQTIPGVGWWGAAVFLGEVGPVSQYPGARSIEKLAGLNLCEQSSGAKQGERHISRRGRSTLRQLAYQLAVGGLRHNEEFKEYYEEKLARCGEKTKALVALGAKILRVMYGVAKSGRGYVPLAQRREEYEQRRWLKGGQGNADLGSLRGPQG